MTEPGPAHADLIYRTAKRLGMATPVVERVIDVYADEYIQLERKLRLDAAEQARLAAEALAAAKDAEATEAPVTAEKTPRKRSAKVGAAAKPSDAPAEDTTT